MNPMIVKGIIAVFFLLIFFSLGSSLFFLIRDKGESSRAVTALSWRIGLSLAIFVLLLIAFAMGWISPR